MHSRQVAWWPTHQFLTEYLAKSNLGDLPAAGTPRWCALADGDPRKLAALAVGGEHFVLRCEIAQEAAAEASKAIAAAEDWPVVARLIRSGRGPAYIPRRAS
ncbi:DUF2742 domain-containing protein [Mycolicibacter senuensis]|uniref:DUF2742 domain-containing protein n=1 Tax=Mycolicibacter senuensis TaxID=386913 RepID=A0A7I9XPI7_9MYCO|nr:DUF2742 domain-containing protein [Mycolicibacter senuensis]ORW69817.1 hypothetical protein AWC24_04645 [Mycolicibacter senuensis]GFG71849.1 hypothetical protein MSEN_35690 [Mycolicibacter senuensis]